MLPPKHQEQASWLREELRRYGWSTVGIEQPFEHEWWAAEIWVLESFWSPAGVRLHLVFLIDPMDGGVVWAVGASLERPVDRAGAERVIERLGHGWKDRLPGFLEGLSTFRDDRG